MTDIPHHDATEPETHHLTDIERYSDSYLLAVYLDLASTTLNDYRFKLTTFIRYCLSAGIKRVEQVSPTHIRSFLAERLQINSPVSVHGYYRVIHRFFNWLVEEDELKDSPCLRVKPPKAPLKVIKIFTPEHIKKMLLLCEDGTRTGVRNKAIIFTLLDTGLRLSELANIRLQDIDIKRGIITVMGKGARQRVVGVSKPTLIAILRYYRDRPGQHEQLWLSEEGHPLTAGGIACVFKAMKKRAGFPDVRLSAHTFRHTSGTMALLNGASEREVQLLLGHSTPRMTQHYTATINSEYAVKRHKEFSPVTRLLK